jgi:hypothetical protein
MKYDDASWHYGGNFPKDLPASAGATHIAMFVAWAVLNGLASDLHQTEFVEELSQLRTRSLTPVEWFLGVCDGKFTDEDLCPEGNDFGLVYYGHDNGLHTQPGSFLADFGQAFPEAPTLYAVAPTWASYDRIAPVFGKRFSEWRDKRSPTP